MFRNVCGNKALFALEFECTFIKNIKKGELVMNLLVYFFMLFFLIFNFTQAQENIQYPKTKGVFVTTYPWIAAENPNVLNWLKKFKIVEVGGFDDESYIEKFISELLSNNVKPIIYEWMPAGYYRLNGKNNEFMEWVYKNKQTYTLNPNGPFIMCDGKECEDLYFDLGKEELISRRLQYFNNSLNKIGAVGLFFDWASGTYINEDSYRKILREWYFRHPDKDYLEAVGDFYRTLKENTNILTVTNQGFRNAKNVLPYTDYDLTESYATSVDKVCCSNSSLCGKVNILYKGKIYRLNVYQTVYYPVSNDACSGSISDTIQWLNYLKGKLLYAGSNFKGYIYLNYAAPEYIKTNNNEKTVYILKKPKNAIYFGYAIPKLRGWNAYTEVILSDDEPHRLPLLEQDEVYFADLGNPLGISYEHFQNEYGDYYVRYYENGFVLAGKFDHSSCLTLTSPHIREGKIYDIYNKEVYLAKNQTITFHIKPEKDQLTGDYAPLGRVFVYLKKEKVVGSSCGENKIYDCSFNCVDKNLAYNWIGDGYCDDGRWGINLNCSAFYYDRGDCE